MSPEAIHELTHALKQLTITTPVLNRDRLLFEAGRRSQRSGWHWLAIASLCLCLTCASWILPFRNAPVTQQTVHLPPLVFTEPRATVPDSNTESRDIPSPFTYLSLLQDTKLEKYPPSITGLDTVQSRQIPTAGSYQHMLPITR